MRETAVMSVGTALSRITGFGRIAAMAWAIGGTESKLPDTYNIANSMSNVVYQLVIGEVLATIFVPIFVQHIKTKKRDESWQLASSILNISILLSTLFVVATVLAAPWIIKIYTFRIDDPLLRLQQEQVGAFLLRLIMPQMIFYSIGAVLTGLLNANRRFAAPMFAPLLNNLIVIGTFVTFRMTHGTSVPALDGLTTFDKVLLGGGTTLGVVVMTLALWPSIRQLKGTWNPRLFAWRHPAIRHVGSLARFSLAYVLVNQVGLWVVTMLANQTQGGVSAYQAAWILYQLPYGIFAVSVMTALMPRMSAHHVEGDTAAVRRVVSQGLRTTAFIVIPASAGLVALSRPLIRLLLERGIFTGASTTLYAQTFVFMALGLAFYAAFQQIMRAFYAMQDTKTPWAVNMVCVGTNIATAIPLYNEWGVPGLGLSHAICYFAGAIVGGAILRKRLGGIDGGALLRAHVKIGVASVITGLAAWQIARALEGPTVMANLFQVTVAVLGGLVLYGGLARMLGIEEFAPVRAMLSSRIGRRK